MIPEPFAPVLYALVYILVAPFLGDRVSLTGLLKTICREYGPNCTRCSAGDDGARSAAVS